MAEKNQLECCCRDGNGVFRRVICDDIEREKSDSIDGVMSGDVIATADGVMVARWKAKDIAWVRPYTPEQK